jgi:hypothetical protein
MALSAKRAADRVEMARQIEAVCNEHGAEFVSTNGSNRDILIDIRTEHGLWAGIVLDGASRVDDFFVSWCLRPWRVMVGDGEGVIRDRGVKLAWRFSALFHYCCSRNEYKASHDFDDFPALLSGLSLALGMAKDGSAFEPV